MKTHYPHRPIKSFASRFLIRVGLVVSIAMTGILAGCNTELDENDTQNIQQWQLIDNCDLHKKACGATQGDQTVSLKISPHPIPIARPLGIEVKLTNLNAQKVELDISGKNMYMGFNRVPLKSTKPGRFVGTSMLAFCTTAKMDWQITLMIHRADGTQIQVPYSLQTVNR